MIEVLASYLSFVPGGHELFVVDACEQILVMIRAQRGNMVGEVDCINTVCHTDAVAHG